MRQEDQEPNLLPAVPLFAVRKTIRAGGAVSGGVILLKQAGARLRAALMGG